MTMNTQEWQAQNFEKKKKNNNKKKKSTPLLGVEMAHSGPKKSTFCKNALERFVR